jgi:transposase InsO family protein
MQLWQLDVTASLFLASGRECKVITGIDDHSRYCVIATVVYRATGRAVCAAFVAAMREYGVPAEVLSDNGKQFTGRFGKPRPAEVLFERICRENGITQRLTKPRSPTTTGKIERLHQTLQLELLNEHEPFTSIEDAQAAIDAWRQDYNADRPHQSLGMAFPTARFARPPARCCRCGCPPNLAHPDPCGPPRLPRLGQRPLGPCQGSRHELGRRWSWTGWCRRRATCGSPGSRSGSARP